MSGDEGQRLVPKSVDRTLSSSSALTACSRVPLRSSVTWGGEDNTFPHPTGLLWGQNVRRRLWEEDKTLHSGHNILSQKGPGLEATRASGPVSFEGCTHQSWKIKPENSPALWACSHLPTMPLPSSSITAHIPQTPSSARPRDT